MSLVRYAVQIVEAYVSRNELPPQKVTSLLRDVHQSLATLNDGVEVAVESMGETLADAPAATEKKSASRAEEPAAPRKPVPAVPLDKAVTEDAVFCLVCGKSCKTLRGHLSKSHGMDVVAYRTQYGLDKNFPIVAPSYSNKRRQLAMAAGLGEKLQRARRKTAATKAAAAAAAPTA